MITQNPKRSKVKLFKDGDNMGVQTTAATEDEFWSDFVPLLAELIEKGVFVHDWEFQLDRWLPSAFELVAKLRGYKADVFEERVIYSGAPFAKESDAIDPEKERDRIGALVEATS